MRLYRLRDVKRTSILRYGSLEALAEAKAKRAHRSHAIQATRSDKRAERSRQLEQA